MRQSQKTMMDHSEVKIRLLKLYLEKYLNILTKSQYCTDIHLYDLFCGEGIYDGEGKGSPIVILEMIKEIYNSNKSPYRTTEKYNCHFNDLDLKKIEKLKAEISKRDIHNSDFGNLKFTNEEYRTILQDVVEEINSFQNQKAFVFIDPYGYKEIRATDIKALLENKKSEVLLFLPTQFMFRFEAKGTPISLIEFIEDLIPYDQWPNNNTGIDFIETLTEAFRASFEKGFYIDSFIITRDINQYFCLFFFTSHIKGFEKMLDSKWAIDAEDGRGWIKQDSDNLFSNIDKKANTYKFEQKLIDFLKTERCNSEIYEFTLQNGHLPTHANAILSKFREEGILNIVNADGTPSSKPFFYNNYDNYKNNPCRIKLKLK
jgi:three-Cys-motif partner protein